MALLVSKNDKPAYIVYSQAEFLRGMFPSNEKPRVAVKAWKSNDPVPREISDCGFSVRTLNALQNAGIRYVRQLILFYKAEIDRLPGIGRRCLREIEDFLDDYGLRLGAFDNSVRGL